MSNSSLAKQLKVFAVILLILGIVASIWSGIDAIDSASPINTSSVSKEFREFVKGLNQSTEDSRESTRTKGIMTLILGPICSYVGFLVLFSIASLLETSDLIHGNSYDMRAVRDVVAGDSALVYKKNEEEPRKIVIAPSTEGGWICPSCGTRNNKSSMFCKDCGKYK